MRCLSSLFFFSLVLFPLCAWSAIEPKYVNARLKSADLVASFQIQHNAFEAFKHTDGTWGYCRLSGRFLSFKRNRLSKKAKVRKKVTVLMPCIYTLGTKKGWKGIVGGGKRWRFRTLKAGLVLEQVYLNAAKQTGTFLSVLGHAKKRKKPTKKPSAPPKRKR